MANPIKYYTLIWYKTRNFKIVTDVFPKVTSLYTIIKTNLALDCNSLTMIGWLYFSTGLNLKINAPQRALYKLQITYNDILKIIADIEPHLRAILNSTLSAGTLKIISELEARFKILLNENISINMTMDFIYSSIEKIISNIQSSLKLNPIISSIVKFNQQNNPLQIKTYLKLLLSPVITKLRRLFEYGYINSETDEEMYNTSLFYMDEQILQNLDISTGTYIYWGCNPYNQIGLYLNGTSFYDKLVKQGGRWQVQRQNKVWMAYDTPPHATFNPFNSDMIGQITLSGQLYKVILNNTDAGTTNRDCLCNIFPYQTTQPTGTTEAVYNNAGQLSLWIKQSRFATTPSNTDIYNFLVSNNFKLLVTMDNVSIEILQNENLVSDLNMSDVINVNGATFIYKQNVDTISPENPMRFFGLGEGSYFQM